MFGVTVSLKSLAILQLRLPVRYPALSSRWLDWGTRIGLAALVAGFFAYALGLVEPLVPLEQLPALWSLPVERWYFFAEAKHLRNLYYQAIA